MAAFTRLPRLAAIQRGGLCLVVDGKRAGGWLAGLLRVIPLAHQN